MAYSHVACVRSSKQDKIRGLTHECFIEKTIIDNQEQCRGINDDLETEHPHATDGVECFFICLT